MLRPAGPSSDAAAAAAAALCRDARLARREGHANAAAGLARRAEALYGACGGGDETDVAAAAGVAETDALRDDAAAVGDLAEAKAFRNADAAAPRDHADNAAPRSGADASDAGVVVSLRRPRDGEAYAPGAAITFDVGVEITAGPCADAVRADPAAWLVCYGTVRERRCAPLVDASALEPLRALSEPAVSAWLERRGDSRRCGGAAATVDVPAEFATASSVELSSAASSAAPAAFATSSAARRVALQAGWHAARAAELRRSRGVRCSGTAGVSSSCQCPAVDVAERSLVCHAPRALSKVIKVVLRRLAGERDPRRMAATLSCPPPGLTLLTDLEPAAAGVVLESPLWRRAAFLRDPFARVASLFDIRDSLARLDATNGVVPDSFDAFVRAVAATRDDDADEHVASQSALCGLGRVAYDDLGYWPADEPASRNAAPWLGRLCERRGVDEAVCTGELGYDLCAAVDRPSGIEACYGLQDDVIMPTLESKPVGPELRHGLQDDVISMPTRQKNHRTETGRVRRSTPTRTSPPRAGGGVATSPRRASPTRSCTTSSLSAIATISRSCARAGCRCSRGRRGANCNILLF